MIKLKYIPKDKKGNLKCVCGYETNPYNTVPDDFDKCKQRLLMDQHVQNCKKWNEYISDIEFKEREKARLIEEAHKKQHDEDEAYQKKFNRKLIIGWVLIIFGLIWMYFLGVSSSHQYAWTGALIIFIGFYTILGFGGILSTIFGSLFESMTHTNDLLNISKDISATQKFVEGRNIMFDRDVLGQKIDNPFKHK